MTTLTNLETFALIPVELATSTITGADVDLQGRITNRQLKAIATVLWTAAGDSDETVDITLEESDTTVASDFAAITGAAFTTIQDDQSPALAEIHFRTDKRYIRAIATMAGTTPSFTVGVACVAEMRYTP
jgi:hypothetical protein